MASVISDFLKGRIHYFRPQIYRGLQTTGKSKPLDSDKIPNEFDVGFGVTEEPKCDFGSDIIDSVKSGEFQNALSMYWKMQSNVAVREYAYLSLMKACVMLDDVAVGLHIHASVLKIGFLDRNHILGGVLVGMYVKLSMLSDAKKAFDLLLERDLISWTTLITGYVELGYNEEALYLFQQMQEEDISPDAFTYVCVLKSCGTIGILCKGQHVYTEVTLKGIDKDVFIGSALVDMLSKCGSLHEAQEVFDKLPIRNVVTWTALITGYVEHGFTTEASHYLEQMQHEGIAMNSVTLICSLKSSSSLGAIEKGRETHCETIMKGLERHMPIGNTLVDMYAKCGYIRDAKDVFDKLNVRTVVSYNALISGYVEQKQNLEALQLLNTMQCEDFSPNNFTLSCILKACGGMSAHEEGKQMHSLIIVKGFLGEDTLLGNSLVDMYTKFGMLAEARQVFKSLALRDVVSWTSLITGYTEYGDLSEALHCFEQMQSESVPATTVTFVCSLKACGNTGSILKGHEIHSQITMKGLEDDVLIGNMLVSMYAKCGLLEDAKEVFDKLRVCNVVSCNALMKGYGDVGENQNILFIFGKMIDEDVNPDSVTFVSVLNACSHAGLVEKGETYFDSISKRYGLTPTLDHYNCIVDLLTRAGHLERSAALIQKMPYPPGLTVWHTVLGAARKWCNVAIGEYAFEQAVELYAKDDVSYICMFNTYIDAGMYDAAQYIEELRMERRACFYNGS